MDNSRYLFDILNKEFNFDYDLAASIENTKCDKFYDEDDNSLKQKWTGTCFLNPPWGHKEYKLVDWIKKSYESDCTVVMLIPARTNTRWWNEGCRNKIHMR